MNNKEEIAIDLLKEVLEELRIKEDTLLVMSQGYSANVEGVIDTDGSYEVNYRYPVVQLSQYLSKKMIDSKLKLFRN